MRILGIDPGIGICGFGLIEATSRTKARALDYGAVTTTIDAPLPSRLKEMYDSLNEVFDQTKPEMVAVEKLFFSKNITTGIAVAEARGIVLLVAEQRGLPIYEYTPNQIKKSLSPETIQIYDKKNINQIKDLLLIEPNMKAKLLKSALWLY